MASAGAPIQDTSLVREVFMHVTRDLGAILGLEFELSGQIVERLRARPAGKRVIHISFKLGFEREGGSRRYGALLVPLPEAVTMAGSLLMLSGEAIARRRAEPNLDLAAKDALLEIGSMVAAAASTALAESGVAGVTVRSEGCQGVRADVRPAFPYEEGAELVVGRASACLPPFAPFEMLLLLPDVTQ
jgi:hypothetical protein